jgi:RNA polymerase sigma factor (sigma-70 family)
MKNQNDKKKYSKEEVILEIQTGRHKALAAMYPLYQERFMRWAKSWSHSFDDDVLIDAYLEAMLVFYQNVVSGHLIVLTTDVENYLITIGKNYLMKKYDKSKHTLYVDSFTPLTLPVEEDILTQIIIHEHAEEKKTKLIASIAELGKKCQELLKLSFYENLKASQIKELMNYKDETTVYVTKAKCIAQLRALILKK